MGGLRLKGAVAKSAIFLGAQNVADCFRERFKIKLEDHFFDDSFFGS